MQLIAWTGLCLLVSLALQRHVFALSMAALLIWCAVPGVAGHYLTGTFTALADVHPAAILVLTTLAVQIVGRPDRLIPVLDQPGYRLTLLLIVIAAASAAGFLVKGLSTVSAVVNQLVGPIALFFLLGSCFRAQPRTVRQFRATVLGIAAVEAVLAVVQAAVSRPLLWTSAHEGQYWFNDNYHRWMGTFDHPLILSLFLACSIFLLADLQRWWVILVLFLLSTGGILVTQSRTGFVAAVVGAAYLVLRGRIGAGGKLAFVVVGAAASWSAYLAGVGAPLQNRVADDTGSSGARQLALEFFSRHWREYVWTGGGLDSSFQVAAQAGLETSLESAFLMYTVDIGLVTTALYFLVMVTIVRTSFRGRAALGSAVAAAVAVVIVQTFSGLSSTTAVAAMVWSLLAMAGFSVTRAAPQTGIRPAPVKTVAPLNADAV